MADGRHLATHPDENLLSAFAEHSLTVKERQSVLEHLATCVRCRDVVFVAQQALLETENQPEAVPLPAMAGRRWVRWGSLGAAGVLAVLLIAVPIAVYRHRGHALPGRGQEIAAGGRLGAPAATGPGAIADSLSEMAPPEPAKRREAKRVLSAPAVKTHAEGSAEIAGSVADRSGAAIPGAHVTVRAAATGNAKSAVTNAQGQFDVAALRSGSYQVEVQAPGFSMFSQPVTVQPSERASLDAKLDVGAASQTVAVSAGNGAAAGGVMGGLVSSGAGGNLIPKAKASNMPLTGRNSAPAAAPAPPPLATASAMPAPAPQAIGGPVASGMVINGAAPAATFAVKDGVVQRCLGTECVALNLPLGARAVSVAADGQTVMALDSDGNVFLRNGQDLNGNAGEQWTQAKMQWLGKAVGLRVEPPAQSRTLMMQRQGAFSGNATHGVNAARSAPTCTPPRATFELTNDKGQVWVSSDEGKTWAAK